MGVICVVKPLHKYRFRIGTQPRRWQPGSVCDGVQVPAGVHLRNFAVVVQVPIEDVSRDHMRVGNDGFQMVDRTRGDVGVG
jgi:hypothetical protein